MSAIDDLTVKLARVRGHWRITPGGKKVWVETYTDSRDKKIQPLKEAMGIKAKSGTNTTQSSAKPAQEAQAAVKSVQQDNQRIEQQAKPSARPQPDRPQQDARGTHYDRAKEVLAKAAEFEPQLTKALQSIVKDNTGSMAGLEFRLKTEDSLARKIRDKAVAKKIPEEAYAAEIGDAVRYTALYDPVEYVNKAEATLKALESQGHTVIDVENNWARGDAYSGVNAVLQAENGMRWELQFHTEDSLVAKERAHEFYDIVRDPSKPKKDRIDAYSRSTAQWEDVEQPDRWQDFGKQIFRPDPELFDQKTFDAEKVTAKQRLDRARKDRLKQAAKKKRQQLDAANKAPGSVSDQQTVAASAT